VHATHRGNYAGPEPERLALLKLAALSGAPYVDVEFKAAPLFFAGVCVSACAARRVASGAAAVASTLQAQQQRMLGSGRRATSLLQPYPRE
jgi:hypothetical protein